MSEVASVEPSPPLLRISGLTKAFGATRALRDASFELRSGEVHALAGENGSGKSTLVKILSGVQSRDGGAIELLHAPGVQPTAPKAAQAVGIATVFQEVLVAEARSVLDNVWLGVDGLVRARVPSKTKRSVARQAFQELLGRPVDLDAPVEDLSLSDRQACCIVRALLRRPRILILDEATSSLDVATRDRLFRIVDRLSRDGAGVVFITHRLDELTEIGDRITVMRSGETVATLERGHWTGEELVRLMTGAEQQAGRDGEHADSGSGRRGRPALSVRNLLLKPGRRPIDVEIHAGELVGVAGLEGHGQDAFLEALRGARILAGEVVRRESDGEHAIRSPADAAAHGVAYVPRERKAAIFGWMSIRENFGMPTLARDTRAGWLRRRATEKRLASYVRELGIVLADPEHRVTTLSGGNQQKLLLARWLAADPGLLVLNDPTRGVDIGTKQHLYALLTELTRAGLAVVMLSTEVDEHVELMDRVLVFREHELHREIGRAELSRSSLVAAFFGQNVRQRG